MSPTNARAFNTMRQRLKKHNVLYQDQIDKYRADPASTEEEASAASDSDDDASDSSSDAGSEAGKSLSPCCPQSMLLVSCKLQPGLWLGSQVAGQPKGPCLPWIFSQQQHSLAQGQVRLTLVVCGDVHSSARGPERQAPCRPCVHRGGSRVTGLVLCLQLPRARRALSFQKRGGERGRASATAAISDTVSCCCWM